MNIWSTAPDIDTVLDGVELGDFEGDGRLRLV